MTQREYDSTPGLYPRNTVTTRQVVEIERELKQIERLLAKVAERLAIQPD